MTDQNESDKSKAIGYDRRKSKTDDSGDKGWSEEILNWSRGPELEFELELDRDWGRAESEERALELEKSLEAAYREQTQDPEWQAEVALWDCVVGEGIPENDLESQKEIALSDREIAEQSKLLDADDSEAWLEGELESWQEKY